MNGKVLAQVTGYISVIDDIISIKSADVVFAVGADKVIPPADGDSIWKTLFSQLILTSDGYVWTCTKIVKTDGSVEYSGKYCLGACTDFADIIELYALGDSNTTPPESGWMQSYTPTKGKWLWTKNELHFQNSTTIYTDPVCIGYFANDGVNGTSFTPRGTALGHYETSAAFEEEMSSLAKGYYICDQNWKGEPVPTVIYRYGSTRSYSVASTGDAYRIGTNLWVNNGEKWVDFGDIQGPQGEDGKGAIWAVLSRSQVTFESDKDGMVVEETKSLEMRVIVGEELIPSSDYNVSLMSSENFDSNKVNITTGGVNTKISISSSGISSKKVADDFYVTCPYSNIRLKITYGNYSLIAIINIAVDLSVQDGYFHTSIEGLEARYTTLQSTTSDNTAKITQHEGLLTVNADRIEAVNRTVQETVDYASSIDGKVHTLEEKSAGYVSRDDYAGLFAEYAKNSSLVARADIAAFITKDEAGNMISAAKISADQVLINANHILSITGNYLTIDTDNFKVAQDGTVTCNKGVFNDAEVNGVITSNGEDFTIKIDNGVIYFITDEATYHLGLNSSGKPDWLTNRPYVYSETFYTGNLLIDNTEKVMLYTTDHVVYYTDVNLKNKASGTYYKADYSGYLLTVADSVYYVYAGPFIKMALYRKCTFSDGSFSVSGFVATGYSFYLNDSGSVEKYTSKQYFKPVSSVSKKAITEYAAIKQVGSGGDVSDIDLNDIDISEVTDTYIYPLQASGRTESVFSNYTTVQQDIGDYMVKNFTI